MKIVCHQSTEPTARKVAELIGANLLILEGPITTLLQQQRQDTEPLVNWGYRMRLASDTVKRLREAGLVVLNGTATLDKRTALQMLSEAKVSVPPFVTGRVLLRPPMTRKGRMLGEIDGIAIGFIDKDLEFRVDVFGEYAFRLHVKTGPADKVAWNREGTEWVTFGKKTMVSGCSERFGVPETQTREIIALAKKAVAALNYDFGAVDIIRERGTNKFYVLEVNSAPGLDENGLQKYAARIKRACEVASGFHPCSSGPDDQEENSS